MEESERDSEFFSKKEKDQLSQSEELVTKTAATSNTWFGKSYLANYATDPSPQRTQTKQTLFYHLCMNHERHKSQVLKTDLGLRHWNCRWQAAAATYICKGLAPVYIL